MSIVHQLDKRSGITYVYESEAYWDKEKQQSRSHRRLIGRLDGHSSGTSNRGTQIIKKASAGAKVRAVFIYFLKMSEYLLTKRVKSSII